MKLLEPCKEVNIRFAEYSKSRCGAALELVNIKQNKYIRCDGHEKALQQFFSLFQGTLTAGRDKRWTEHVQRRVQQALETAIHCHFGNGIYYILFSYYLFAIGCFLDS